MAATAILQVSDLTVRYPSGAALDGVTLALAPGEFLGIIGPNGAGKSTLVKAMGRLLRPDSGDVTLGGRPVGAMPTRQVARRLAIVHQELAPGFEFSVRDVVLMGRAPHLGRFASEGPNDLRAAGAAMAATGVAHLAGRSLRELSGGERQRVMIARALAQEPEVLLLDEPNSHLDLGHQLEVFNLLRTLGQQGIAVVAILHDLNLAALYCRRLVLMHRGRIEAMGEPAAVLTPEAVRRVYGCDVLVTPHPRSGAPQLVLLPE